MNNTETKFEKVKKKYALNNSYFKNRNYGMPSNPAEVYQYFNEYGELPYENGELNDNWIYECFVEFQKRNGVYNSQFFTPENTAQELVYRLLNYANLDDEILEPCCGFGQITRTLANNGFQKVVAFDNDAKLVEIASDFIPGFEIVEDDYMSSKDERKYEFIISNPPYEVKELTAFLEYSLSKLHTKGKTVLLIPNGFLDKTRPAALVKVLNGFSILERIPMLEEFARTKINAEIVVLEKI